MSHMVIYRGTDGKPGYHQTDDIHDAVTFVEQLRNDNGVEHARIFRLEEVNFEYRPYFRVELKAGDPALASAPAVPAVEAPAPAPAAPPAVEAAVASVPDKAASAAEGATDTAAAAVSSAATEVSTAVDPAATVDAGTLTENKVTDPKPPDSAATSSDSENGVGARRGLFGR